MCVNILRSRMHLLRDRGHGRIVSHSPCSSERVRSGAYAAPGGRARVSPAPRGSCSLAPSLSANLPRMIRHTRAVGGSALLACTSNSHRIVCAERSDLLGHSSSACGRWPPWDRIFGLRCCSRRYLSSRTRCRRRSLSVIVRHAIAPCPAHLVADLSVITQLTVCVFVPAFLFVQSFFKSRYAAR